MVKMGQSSMMKHYRVSTLTHHASYFWSSSKPQSLEASCTGVCFPVCHHLLSVPATVAGGAARSLWTDRGCGLGLEGCLVWS